MNNKGSVMQHVNKKGRAALVVLTFVALALSFVPIMLHATGVTTSPAKREKLLSLGMASYELELQEPFADIFPVHLRTQGTGRMRIMPSGDSQWGKDILLWGWWCDGQLVDYEMIGDERVAEEHYCPGTTVVHFLIRAPGTHALRIKFGSTDHEISTDYEPPRYRVLTTGLVRYSE